MSMATSFGRWTFVRANGGIVGCVCVLHAGNGPTLLVGTWWREFSRIERLSELQFPFVIFLDLVVVMTLVFSTSQRQWSSFPKKSGYPVSVSQAGHHRAQQIDRQSALQTEQKENTDRNPFTRTIHPHNHVGKSSFLKTLNYFLMIQRLVLSFRNLHLFHWNVTKR